MDKTLKSLKGIALILLLSLFFGLPAFSQVTIGALETPLPGALLDLKQNDDPAGGTTATKGMMYPRVALVSLTSLSPLDDAPASLTQYKGMTVYNVTVNTAANLQEGLYVWDGAKWSVFQTGTVNNMNNTFIYTLYNPGTGTPNLLVTTGNNTGTQGSLLTWIIGGVQTDHVELPEDGAYMFSFRLYGNAGTVNQTNSFYFSSLVNDGQNTTIFDVQEINLSSYAPVAAYNRMTYSTNLTAAGKKGDKVYFRLAELSDPHSITWTLVGSTDEKLANRTSMIFWKL